LRPAWTVVKPWLLKTTTKKSHKEVTEKQQIPWNMQPGIMKKFAL
jgi:hypothetical protein